MNRIKLNIAVENLKEELAKEHLENTSDITMNMGYVNLKKKEQTEEIKNDIEQIVEREE